MKKKRVGQMRVGSVDFMSYYLVNLGSHLFQVPTLTPYCGEREKKEAMTDKKHIGEAEEREEEKEKH